MPEPLTYFGLALAFAALIWGVLRINGKQRRRRRRRDAARGQKINLFTRTADQ